MHYSRKLKLLPLHNIQMIQHRESSILCSDNGLGLGQVHGCSGASRYVSGAQ